MTDKTKKLVSALREEAEWCKAVEFDIPICTEDHIRQAADLIETLENENNHLKKGLYKKLEWCQGCSKGKPEYIKPQLGVAPYYISISKRIQELAQAIDRNAFEDDVSKLKLWAIEIIGLCNFNKKMERVNDKI